MYCIYNKYCVKFLGQQKSLRRLLQKEKIHRCNRVLRATQIIVTDSNCEKIVCHLIQ